MLTTSATLNAELGTTGVDYDALIAQWSAAIETFCRRSFAAVAGAETIRFDRWRERLVLDRVPIVSVAAVVLNGEALDPAAVEVESAGAGFLLRVDADGRSLGWPCGKVVVTYTAGFATVPPDVERACLDLCVRSVMAKGRDPALRSWQYADGSAASYLDAVTAPETGLPSTVAALLAPYRCMVLP